MLRVASLLALAMLSCSFRLPTASSAPAPSVSVSPVAAPGTSPSSPATLASAPVKDIILVRSLGIDSSFTETSCADTSLLTVVPSGATLIYADCGVYWRFVASDSGPLAALLSAPAGTPVEWVNGVGLHVLKSLNGVKVTAARDTASGQFPGHGIQPGSALAFIQLRNGSQQTELTAK